jgi:hypothetical protein
MKTFFIVLARDRKAVEKKIKELDRLGFPFIIVCGEKVEHPNCAYRKPVGKYDAINFGARFLPEDCEIVVLNDVDTEIHNVEGALQLLEDKYASLTFARVQVKSGPQKQFYSVLDNLRSKILVAASGELMVMRKSNLESVLPLQPCKAEDSYILFKTLEQGHKTAFARDCYVITERTKEAVEEEKYKRRTVCGIYQALSKTKPPRMIKLFYTLLPLLSPLLLVMGKKGFHYMKGILLGYTDYVRGDKAASWARGY